MEKFNTKGKKVQKVIAKHLEQSDKIEKWWQIVYIIINLMEQKAIFYSQ